MLIPALVVSALMVNLNFLAQELLSAIYAGNSQTLRISYPFMVKLQARASEFRDSLTSAMTKLKGVHKYHLSTAVTFGDVGFIELCHKLFVNLFPGVWDEVKALYLSPASICRRCKAGNLDFISAVCPKFIPYTDLQPQKADELPIGFQLGN